MNLTNDQIQVLLVEKLSGTIAPEDDELIEQLLAGNEELRQQWLHLQQHLDTMGGPPDMLGEEQAWSKLKAGLRPSGLISRMPLLKRFAVAAATLFVIVAGAMVVWHRKSANPIAREADSQDIPVITLAMDNGQLLALRRPQLIQLGALEFRADQKQLILPTQGAAGEEWGTLQVPSTLDYKISLADGSEVWLNSQSHLRFPLRFQGSRREVFLQGEAYFKVSKDALHPFIVHTGQTEVLVVGTQFNLNSYEKDSIATALVEGAVITRNGQGRSVGIRPGLQSVYSEAHGFVTKPFDETEVLSWLKGVYYFHSRSLGDISKVLSRWYGVEIEFANTGLQTKTFSGQLIKSQDLQSFLDNLNLSEETHAIVKGRKVIFQ